MTFMMHCESGLSATACSVLLIDRELVAGIILVEYLEKGATISGSYYADQIRRLRKAIKENRRGKLRARVLFHRDNAPVHKAAVAMAAFRESGFELLEQPPYSPDLAPSDYDLLGDYVEKYIFFFNYNYRL
ncbi:jg8871 [Pararge aegeria aegeria]|uniref:Jg8871 protein n=1 Tax=Pararge aegeria aegeria TaxID=348720 RepID=A0A8S4R7Z1_9NEOP|nr:jg8871 [Pararge aegeria aegeria]